MTDHQQHWDAALATEHTHQQELLATLRGELGAVARECAEALTALDAFVGGLSGAASVATAAQKGYAHAKLVHDLSQRLPTIRGGAPGSAEDRELLERISADESVRAEMENALGPAAVAALRALQPLSRWVPAIASLRRGEASMRELAGQAGKDLVEVLEATAQVTGSEAEALAVDVAALGESLRGTAEHVEGAVRAIKDGKLGQVLAEARKQLEADLQELHGVIQRAEDAAEEWLHARRAEHGELTEEVRVKLDRIERIRGLLGAIMPHLQAVARSLATVERVVAVEHRLTPEHVAAAEASRMSLLLDLASLWETVLPGGPPAPHVQARKPSRPRRPLVIAGIVVLIAAGIGIAVAVSGGGGKKTTAAPTTTAASTTTTTTAAPTTTTAVAVPPAPKVSPVHSTFDQNQLATFYSIDFSEQGGGPPTYDWKLTPPAADPTCNQFTSPKPKEAVWHHGDQDGCNHNLMGPAGHLGTVTVTVKNAYWSCTASFFGTNTQTGPPAQRCKRV